MYKRLLSVVGQLAAFAFVLFLAFVIAIVIIGVDSDTQALFVSRNTPLPHRGLFGSLGFLNQGLIQHLEAPGWKFNEWFPGSIPATCATQLVAHHKLSVTDITVDNVTYSDCSVPWILCRHKDSPNPITTIVENFGRVPVGMRQHVRHVMTMRNREKHLLAYHIKGSIVFMNGNDDRVDVIMHETGHALDFHGGFNESKRAFSISPKWKDAVAEDTMVPTRYAASNLQEDLAETTVLAVYDANVPGGLQGVLEEWERAPVQTQYTTLREQLGDKMKSGGRCTTRLIDSAVVPSKNAHKVVSWEEPEAYDIQD